MLWTNGIPVHSRRVSQNREQPNPHCDLASTPGSPQSEKNFLRGHRSLRCTEIKVNCETRDLWENKPSAENFHVNYGYET